MAPESFKNVEAKWLNEVKISSTFFNVLGDFQHFGNFQIRLHQPNTPVILVGTKVGLKIQLKLHSSSCNVFFSLKYFKKDLIQFSISSKERSEGRRGGAGEVEKEPKIPNSCCSSPEICQGKGAQSLHGMLCEESKGGQIALEYVISTNTTQFQGLKDVFDEAIKIVLNKDKETNRPSCCTLL